jgi:hypothetical protein
MIDRGRRVLVITGGGGELGDRAASIETIRGLGYRFTTPT